MKQAALSYFSDSQLTMIAFALFLFAFIFMLFKVYIYEPKSKYDELSQIPLKEEEVHCE